jgi:hypothetical protein
MEKLSLERDYGREQFGNQYFQDVVSKYGVLTYDDKDAAGKAYYAQFNIKSGDSIVPEYEPANDLGYQWRQFVNGFTQSRDKVSDTLDHYGEHPTEIPGAVGGAIYNGVKNTATGTVAYLTSDVPAWTLTQQVHDQYGVPSAYNLGVGAYSAALSGALVAPSLVAGGSVGITPSWIAEWSPVASYGGAFGYPVAASGSGAPLLLTGGANSGQLTGTLTQLATSQGAADAVAGWRLGQQLATAQANDPQIGTTLSGASAPVKVTAEASVGGTTFFDVNQTARALTTEQASKPTLISDILAPGAPIGTYGDAHAEIGTIQQAYDAGLTEGQSMTIVVRGEQPCTYCISNLKVMADRAGLNTLTVVDGTDGSVIRWTRGSQGWDIIKEPQITKRN